MDTEASVGRAAGGRMEIKLHWQQASCLVLAACRVAADWRAVSGALL